MLPLSGVARPSSMRMVVVLPEPLGPRNPKIDPRGTARSRLLTARRFPKLLPSPVVWMARSPESGTLVTGRWPRPAAGPPTRAHDHASVLGDQDVEQRGVQQLASLDRRGQLVQQCVCRPVPWVLPWPEPPPRCPSPAPSMASGLVSSGFADAVAWLRRPWRRAFVAQGRCAGSGARSPWPPAGGVNSKWLAAGVSAVKEVNPTDDGWILLPTASTTTSSGAPVAASTPMLTLATRESSLRGTSSRV